MSAAPHSFDVVVVGGGLAGLMAAARAEALGATIALVDKGVPGASGGLGGFAASSGAKFSLLPAGSGLTPLVGNEGALSNQYRRTCEHFAALGFARFEVTDRQLRGEEASVGGDLTFRRYHSVLLSPAEIDALLVALSARLIRTQVIRTAPRRLDLAGGSPFRVELEQGGVVEGRRLIVAVGRLGADLLGAACVPETRGKGIDVGVRLGFDRREPLAGLRALGPDAKFMADGVRTFCLNSPGRIFHYPGLGFSLPGGIVAEPDWPEANVGILCRLSDRSAVLQSLSARRNPANSSPRRHRGRGADLGWTDTSRALVGAEVADRLDTFVAKLAASGMVELPDGYDVHYPLLDWYWPVFSLAGQLATCVPGVYAAGDASGHARGLMQAAVMGTLAAEEALI